HSLERAGCEHEALDCADIARRFPQWRLPENVVAVYSPDTGTLPATRCVEVQAARAAAHGCAMREREPVREILPDASGAGVVTDQGPYRADRLVIAAGPWSDGILRQVGVVVPLRVSQEQTVYFRPRAGAEQFEVGRFPIWIHHQELPVYGFPDLHGLGVKVAVHRSGPFIAIGDYTKTPRPEQIDELRSYLERYLPDAAGEAHGLTPCLYTNTPDEDFVVDSLPGLPHIAFAAGFSGHGFKFGIAIGRALADLVQHGATELEIGHLSLARFRSAGP
ncbi:MAG TPA: FAD-dependent oxidoreductase, partial [Ardenticatenaceae bacterium]|nr:FAD-dependent oxidoreductase [Ardenticatenaceae bacterium]